ncbi:MAG: hypothetical protein AAGH92_09205 [Planctomycetota bacterium]
MDHATELVGGRRSRLLRNNASPIRSSIDMGFDASRSRIAVSVGVVSVLLAGCATHDAGQARAPSDSIRGILADLPPLDTAGLTDEQIAQAERARYLDAVLESKQRRDRRRRLQNGGRGPW